jgi:hypothetical protein
VRRFGRDDKVVDGSAENKQRQKKKQVSPLRVAKARRFGRDDKVVDVSQRNKQQQKRKQNSLRE